MQQTVWLLFVSTCDIFGYYQMLTCQGLTWSQTAGSISIAYVNITYWDWYDTSLLSVFVRESSGFPRLCSEINLFLVDVIGTPVSIPGSLGGGGEGLWHVWPGETLHGDGIMMGNTPRTLDFRQCQKTVGLQITWPSPGVPRLWCNSQLSLAYRL